MTFLLMVVVPMITLVVMLIGGYTAGRSKGYREGKAANEPLVTALENTLEQEKKLIAALNKQVAAQSVLTDKQKDWIESLSTNIKLQEGITTTLRQTIQTMEEAADARERTIAAQQASIEIYESVSMN